MATAETAGSHRRSRGAGGRPAPGPPERGLRGPHLPGSDTRRERLSLRIRRRDLGAGAGQGVEALVRVQESEGADLRRAGCVCVCVGGGTAPTSQHQTRSGGKTGAQRPRGEPEAGSWAAGPQLRAAGWAARVGGPARGTAPFLGGAAPRASRDPATSATSVSTCFRSDVIYRDTYFRRSVHGRAVVVSVAKPLTTWTRLAGKLPTCF